MLDLKITGGLLYDGTGAPPKSRDIGITGETITVISHLADVPAARTLNARGKCVSPGFIDVHSHSEIALLANPHAESQLRQGITTEVICNCGLSVAPLLGECKPHLQELWKAYGVEIDWNTMAGYRDRLRTARPSLNVASLVGHNNLRASVLGYKDCQPTPFDLEQMKSLLAAALDEGAFGMSSGLIYSPGVFSSTEELIALARVCAQHGALYTTHMRSERDQVEESVAEAIRIGRESGAGVEISHLKTGGKQNWHRIDRILQLIEEARAGGVDVTADRYPYTASSTDLDVLLPNWAIEGGSANELARLRDPVSRARLREELLQSREPDYWERVMVAQVQTTANKAAEGKTLTQLATLQQSNPVDVLLNLLLEEELLVGGIFFGMSEANLDRFLQQPWLMIGSDSSGRADYGVLRMGHPHPRTFGTFPRLLSCFVQRGVLTLTEAIRKITSLPATKFGLRGRGVLKIGAYADLVVFDPATLHDLSTYDRPWQYPTGIETVIVNGQPTLVGGHHTGTAAGTVLERQ